MRCPKCNQEINPHSERCPNCGTSARLAVPDGDTMTRVRRQISIMRRETEVSDVDLSDASFSPVLKFDKPVVSQPEEVIEQNPADNFPDESFAPVDISDMIDSQADQDSEKHHRELSASIRRIINNKEDDLLAEYYFKDGISDLERYRLAQSYASLEKDKREMDQKSAPSPEVTQSGHSGDAVEMRTASSVKEAESIGSEDSKEMSEAAKRLNNFPEEEGLDKVITSMWEKYDLAVLKTKEFFRVQIAGRVKKLYDQFDARTSGFMNGILNRGYYKKFGAMKRKCADDDGEGYILRRRVWSVTGVLLVLLVCGFFAVKMMMSNEINGKWIVSTDAGGEPNIIMEFKPGGKASILVKSDDGWHIHKQGKYKTMRKNGHDLLTITYEDGDIKRLYYIIDGNSGTFINVDTNVRVVYQLK